MIKVFLLILILGIIPLHFSAGQDESPLPAEKVLIDAGTDQWIIKNTKGDADYPTIPNQIRVFSKKSSKMLFEFTPNDGSFFDKRKAKVITLDKYPRPLLTTIWMRGTRTICLLIFDPALNKEALLHEVCSIDLKYEFKSDHIDITTFKYKDRDDSTIVEESKTEWTPAEISKVAPPDNP